MTKHRHEFFKESSSALKPLRFIDVYVEVLKNPDMLEELARLKQLDITNSAGNTLFHELLVDDQYVLALKLLELGADPTINPDLFQWFGAHSDEELSLLTPPESAAFNDLRMLLEKYYVNHRSPNQAFTPYNSTYLQATLISEKYDELTELVQQCKHYIEPNLVDNEGKSILIMAAKMNRLDVVELLLNNLSSTIDVNLQDNKGATALHYAAAYANFPMMKALLDHGAHALPDKDNLFPIDYFKQKTDEEITEFLDGVAIKASRDVSVNKNDNRFNRYEGWGVEPNAVPAIRAHLQEVEKEKKSMTNPAKIKELDKYIAFVNKGLESYQGISILEQIASNKKTPDKALLDRMSSQQLSEDDDEKVSSGPS